MVVGVERAAPADEAGHLPAPVHLCGNVDRAVDADIAQLLCGSLCNVDAVLLTGHDADNKADLLAVSLVEAVFTHRAARVLQNGLCLFRVIVIVRNVRIVINVALQGAIGGHALPEQDRVDDGLPVNAVADGGDEVAVLRPVVVPEVEENAAVVCRRHVIAGIALLIRKVLCVFRIEQGQINLAGLQLQGLRIVVRDDLEDDAVDLRRTEVIILVFDQHDGLPGVPALQFIWAGADRMAEEIRFLHVLVLQQVLWQNGHGHIVKKGHVRCGQAEHDGLVVGNGDLLHILKVRRVFRAVFGVHDGFDRELYVLGRERLAVMPLHAVAQVEGVGAGALIVFPRFSQTGNDLVAAVVGGQTAEEQHVDLAVLIHGGVDAGVVAAAVNKRRAFVFGHCRGFAACGQRQNGAQHQQQCKNSFHWGWSSCHFGPFRPFS